MKILELLKLGSKILKSRKIKTHLLDSELILSCVLKRSRENLLITLDQKVSKKIVFKYRSLIFRRSTGEPIAYISKKKEFWSKNFFVNKNTLIPRPETELLSENIIKIFKNKKISILDIGTGSGCILLSILGEITESKGVGIDISKKAIDVAKKNSKSLELTSRAKFYTKSLNKISGSKFDLIVSNPPYIKTSDIKKLIDDVKKFEPKLALDGGKDGLDVIRKIIYKSKTILKRKGMLALEIGQGQFKQVSQILKLQGFKNRFLVKDYKNNIRCVLTTLEF